VSPVKYELGFYIPEDDVLHSHRRENLKPYMLQDEFYSALQPFQSTCVSIADKGQWLTSR
jgi:hypothetical protein